jgi:hypothetical protein
MRLEKLLYPDPMKCDALEATKISTTASSRLVLRSASETGMVVQDKRR